MASEDEKTLADLVAEYRNDADAMDRGWLYPPTAEYVRRLLDRIEAAWKREAKAIAMEHAVLPAVCITRPSGNAAAMREALAGLIDGMCFHCDMSEDCKGAPCEKMQKAKAALSAPARNCDRFADELDAQLAFLNEVWLISIDRETMTEQDTYEKWTDEMRTRYGRWLLAPAAERKGEGDGR